MKITVNKIAELAGVSRGTVDRVLHNRSGVKEDVRKKIQEIVETLDYTPNLAGKALVSMNKRIFFSVILSPDFHPFVDEVRKGVESQAKMIKEYGVDIDIQVIKSLNAKEQIAILDDLEKKGVSGIAMLPILEDCIAERVNKLADKGIPVITFNSDLDNTKRLCFVGQNNFKAGETVFALFEEILPYKSKIAVITTSSELACHVHRMEGFMHGLKNTKKGIQLVGVAENQDEEELAFEETMKLCTEHSDLNGIYITGGGTMGLGKALKILKKAGKVKVISHDIVPPVVDLMKEGIIKFTIGQDPYMQGALPIKLLFDYTFKKIAPEKEKYYTNVDIRLNENL